MYNVNNTFDWFLSLCNTKTVNCCGLWAVDFLVNLQNLSGLLTPRVSLSSAEWKDCGPGWPIVGPLTSPETQQLRQAKRLVCLPGKRQLLGCCISSAAGQLFSKATVRKTDTAHSLPSDNSDICFMMLDTLKVLLHLDFNLAFQFEYFYIVSNKSDTQSPDITVGLAVEWGYVPEMNV